MASRKRARAEVDSSLPLEEQLKQVKDFHTTTKSQKTSPGEEGTHLTRNDVEMVRALLEEKLEKDTGEKPHSEAVEQTMLSLGLVVGAKVANLAWDNKAKIGWAMAWLYNPRTATKIAKTYFGARAGAAIAGRVGAGQAQGAVVGAAVGYIQDHVGDKYFLWGLSDYDYITTLKDRGYSEIEALDAWTGTRASKGMMADYLGINENAHFDRLSGDFAKQYNRNFALWQQRQGENFKTVWNSTKPRGWWKYRMNEALPETMHGKFTEYLGIRTNKNLDLSIVERGPLNADSLAGETKLKAKVMADSKWKNMSTKQKLKYYASWEDKPANSVYVEPVGGEIKIDDPLPDVNVWDPDNPVNFDEMYDYGALPDDAGVSVDAGGVYRAPYEEGGAYGAPYEGGVYGEPAIEPPVTPVTPPADVEPIVAEPVAPAIPTADVDPHDVAVVDDIEEAVSAKPVYKGPINHELDEVREVLGMPEDATVDEIRSVADDMDPEVLETKTMKFQILKGKVVNGITTMPSRLLDHMIERGGASAKFATAFRNGGTKVGEFYAMVENSAFAASKTGRILGAIGTRPLQVGGTAFAIYQNIKEFQSIDNLKKVRDDMNSYIKQNPTDKSAQAWMTGRDAAIARATGKAAVNAGVTGVGAVGAAADIAVGAGLASEGGAIAGIAAAAGPVGLAAMAIGMGAGAIYSIIDHREKNKAFQQWQLDVYGSNARRGPTDEGYRSLYHRVGQEDPELHKWMTYFMARSKPFWSDSIVLGEGSEKYNVDGVLAKYGPNWAGRDPVEDFFHEMIDKMAEIDDPSFYTKENLNKIYQDPHGDPRVQYLRDLAAKYPIFAIERAIEAQNHTHGKVATSDLFRDEIEHHASTSSKLFEDHGITLSENMTTTERANYKRRLEEQQHNEKYATKDKEKLPSEQETQPRHMSRGSNPWTAEAMWPHDTEGPTEVSGMITQPHNQRQNGSLHKNSLVAQLGEHVQTSNTKNNRAVVLHPGDNHEDIPEPGWMRAGYNSKNEFLNQKAQIYAPPSNHRKPGELYAHKPGGREHGVTPANTEVSHALVPYEAPTTLHTHDPERGALTSFDPNLHHIQGNDAGPAPHVPPGDNTAMGSSSAEHTDMEVTHRLRTETLLDQVLFNQMDFALSSRQNFMASRSVTAGLA